MAISFETFKELYAKLKEGTISDRALAKEYGVNRNALQQIRCGKHKYFANLGDEGDPTKSIVYPIVDDKEIKKPVRCPICGGYNRPNMPCFVCKIREIKQEKTNKALEVLDKRLEPIKMG